MRRLSRTFFFCNLFISRGKRDQSTLLLKFLFFLTCALVNKNNQSKWDNQAAVSICSSFTMWFDVQTSGFIVRIYTNVNSKIVVRSFQFLYCLTFIGNIQVVVSNMAFTITTYVHFGVCVCVTKSVVFGSLKQLDFRLT